MATRKSPRLNGPSAKARRMDDQPNAVAVAADDPTPSIFKLNDDCCFALFDWLPRKSLTSFGQTCKWAQRVAVDFYKMKHSAIECEVYSSDYDLFDLKNAQQIRIYGSMLGQYHQVKNFCDQPIEKITLRSTTLSTAKVNCLKKVLQKVECVTLKLCKLNGDFYEKFLKFCPTLKVLCIRKNGKNEILIGADNRWLTRKYPTLERLELVQLYVQNGSKIGELKIFFEQNPNVRHFAISSNILEANWELFESTDIKLDVLAIKFLSDNVATFSHKLNSLHERGVFQRLHWYCGQISHEVTELNAFEKLVIGSCTADEYATIIPFLTNLKELDIYCIPHNLQTETVARNLVNLERVNLGRPTYEATVSFIRHAAKLKKLKIDHCGQMSNGTKDGLDLAALNKEREKLAGAGKCNIYVKEYVYLTTKWTTDQTDYSLIELKRDSSYDWDYDFY